MYKYSAQKHQVLRGRVPVCAINNVHSLSEMSSNLHGVPRHGRRFSLFATGVGDPPLAYRRINLSPSEILIDSIRSWLTYSIPDMGIVAVLVPAREKPLGFVSVVDLDKSCFFFFFRLDIVAHLLAFAPN